MPMAYSSPTSTKIFALVKSKVFHPDWSTAVVVHIGAPVCQGDPNVTDNSVTLTSPSEGLLATNRSSRVSCPALIADDRRRWTGFRRHVPRPIRRPLDARSFERRDWTVP